LNPDIVLVDPVRTIAFSSSWLAVSANTWCSLFTCCGQSKFKLGVRDSQMTALKWLFTNASPALLAKQGPIRHPPLHFVHVKMNSWEQGGPLAMYRACAA